MKGLYPEKRLQGASIGRQVVADLRMRILSNDLENGSILSENKLSEEYKVSRSPVREALKILESEGMLELKRSGAKVIGVTEKNIDEIYDVRLMLESFVFHHLMEEENNDVLIRDLQKIYEMMKVAVKFKDADEFSYRDIEFHETVIHSIQHRYISLIWSNFQPVVDCFILLDTRHRMKENYDDFERVLQNHEMLLQSIEQKDKKLMEKAFYHNFKNIKKRSDGLWDNPESLKKASEYHGQK